MPTRTVRPTDWFLVALFALAGTGSIVLSVWQLYIIANVTAPARVYRTEFDHGFYIFKGIFGIVLGLLSLALAREQHRRQSRRV